MKELNKILYDILLKLDLNLNNKFSINPDLLKKYLNLSKSEKNEKLTQFTTYFYKFFNFCFELSLKNMIKDANKFIH